MSGGEFVQRPLKRDEQGVSFVKGERLLIGGYEFKITSASARGMLLEGYGSSLTVGDRHEIREHDFVVEDTTEDDAFLRFDGPSEALKRKMIERKNRRKRRVRRRGQR